MKTSFNTSNKKYQNTLKATAGYVSKNTQRPRLFFRASSYRAQKELFGDLGCSEICSLF